MGSSDSSWSGAEQEQTMRASTLKLFPLLLTAAVARDCHEGEECVPASSCPQYLSDNEKRGFLDINTEEYGAITDNLADMVCNKDEVKVCCRSEELELTDYTQDEVAGGVRPGFRSPFGGIGNVNTRSEFSRCPEAYSCLKRNRAARRFCCRPFYKNGNKICRYARNCFPLWNE